MKCIVYRKKKAVFTNEWTVDIPTEELIKKLNDLLLNTLVHQGDAIEVKIS